MFVLCKKENETTSRLHLCFSKIPRKSLKKELDVIF